MRATCSLFLKDVLVFKFYHTIRAVASCARCARIFHARLLIGSTHIIVFLFPFFYAIDMARSAG